MSVSPGPSALDFISRVVMALDSEVNDNSSKNSNQKVKKCVSDVTVNDKTCKDNANKGKYLLFIRKTVLSSVM